MLPMTPTPAPAIEPTVTPLLVAGVSEKTVVRRTITVRATDNVKGSNFPPRPDFPPLVTNRQRETLFGGYQYVLAP